MNNCPRCKARQTMKQYAERPLHLMTHWLCLNCRFKWSTPEQRDQYKAAMGRIEEAITAIPVFHGAVQLPGPLKEVQ